MDVNGFKTEPFMMALLSSRINAISRQMTSILEKSARSSVMSGARDLSTAICGPDGNVISLPNGFPVHVANMSLITKSIFDFHSGKIKQGDAYLNNSPYHGNTHMADFTIIVPVFFEGEVMFYCTVRGHQADIGNGQPTTYAAFAKNIYEEGALCFPCVKIQESYKDNEDIIRMAKMRIRIPDVWYGDYLAQIGAARIGEKMLIQLMDKYGKDVVKTFCEEWQEYGRRRTVEEIKKLPAGTWYNESTHDPIPGVLDNGVTVRAKVTVDHEKGKVIIDYTENEDSVACGLNMCEATVLSAGRTGVMNHLPEDIPLCEGSLNCIEVIMREGSVVGKAKHPFSSSVATTNIADRAIIAVQSAFNKMGKYELAMGEGSFSQPPSISVISGHDSRYNRDFITQIISGHPGGGAVYGFDGLPVHAICNGGMFYWNSLEVIEQKYPVVFYKQEIITNSGGAGEWDGNPSAEVVIAPADDPVTFAYICDGQKNFPKGAFGGNDGIPARAELRVEKEDKVIKELPMFNSIELKKGEAIVSIISSGAGVGDPLDRDPEAVKEKLREEWITKDKAENTYGVVVNTIKEQYSVDYKATEAMRKAMKEKRTQEVRV